MKDEDSTKVKIDTKIDFTILDNENLQIVTSHQGAFNDIVAAHQVEVMRLKDEGVRQALVKLGWTPPGMAPSIHEDNVRTLRGEAATVAVDHFDNAPNTEFTNRIHPPVEIGTKLYTRPAPVVPGVPDADFDLICNAIDKADTLTMEGDYMLDSDDCIAVVRVMQALLSVRAAMLTATQAQKGQP